MRRVVVAFSVVTLITLGSVCRADTKESCKLAVLSLDAEGTDLNVGKVESLEKILVTMLNEAGWSILIPPSELKKDCKTRDCQIDKAQKAGADLILIVKLKNSKGWCTLSSALYHPRTRREEPVNSITGTCGQNVWSSWFGSLVQDLSKHKLLGEKIRRMHSKAAGLFKAGKYLLVIEVYRVILKADPGNCNALFGIGLTYAKMGKKTEASKHYKNFRKTCPTFIIEPGDYPVPEEFKRPGDYFIDDQNTRG